MQEDRTILLVEDDADDVFIMKRALKQAKITNPLQIASNGQEAIHYLTGQGKYSNRVEYPIPSLVFLDLKLPFKSGFEVLKEIREHHHLDHTVVVALTSSSEERDIQECYRLGARSFLVKPPTQQMLSDLMESLKDYWLKHTDDPQ